MIFDLCEIVLQANRIQVLWCSGLMLSSVVAREKRETLRRFVIKWR